MTNIGEKWSDDEKQQLKEMMLMRLPPATIANKLNRSVSGVRDRIYKIRQQDVIAPQPNLKPYDAALAILGTRHRYCPINGNIVDGTPVTVQQMLSIAGVYLQ